MGGGGPGREGGGWGVGGMGEGGYWEDRRVIRNSSQLQGCMPAMCYFAVVEDVKLYNYILYLHYKKISFSLFTHITTVGSFFHIILSFVPTVSLWTLYSRVTESKRGLKFLHGLFL